MRLSELIGCKVVGADGEPLGSVIDVLAVQDGPIPAGGVDASLRVAGLVVGRDGIGVRLGFHRAGVRGPWLLRSVLEALERRCRFVEWDDVRGRSEGHITVAGTASAYPPPPTLRDRPPL